MNMKTYTITLDGEQLQTVNDALVNMPFFRAAPVINAINEQLRRVVDTKPNGVDLKIEKVDPPRGELPSFLEGGPPPNKVFVD